MQGMLLVRWCWQCWGRIGDRPRMRQGEKHLGCSRIRHGGRGGSGRIRTPHAAVRTLWGRSPSRRATGTRVNSVASNLHVETVGISHVYTQLVYHYKFPCKSDAKSFVKWKHQYFMKLILNWCKECTKCHCLDSATDIIGLDHEHFYFLKGDLLKNLFPTRRATFQQKYE